MRQIGAGCQPSGGRPENAAIAYGSRPLNDLGLSLALSVPDSSRGSTHVRKPSTATQSDRFNFKTQNERAGVLVIRIFRSPLSGLRADSALLFSRSHFDKCAKLLFDLLHGLLVTESDLKMC